MAFWRSGILAVTKNSLLFQGIARVMLAENDGVLAIWRYGVNAMRPDRVPEIFQEKGYG
jgi:hypothetical protein